ncbi:MAG: hypothetical protein ACK48E_02865 [Holosporales bacterium]
MEWWLEIINDYSRNKFHNSDAEINERADHLRLLSQNGRLGIFQGPAGSGKSVAAGDEMFLRLLQGGRVAMAAHVIADVKNDVEKRLKWHIDSVLQRHGLDVDKFKVSDLRKTTRAFDALIDKKRKSLRGDGTALAALDRDYEMGSKLIRCLDPAYCQFFSPNQYIKSPETFTTVCVDEGSKITPSEMLGILKKASLDQSLLRITAGPGQGQDGIAGTLVLSDALGLASNHAGPIIPITERNMRYLGADRKKIPNSIIKDGYTGPIQAVYDQGLVRVQDNEDAVIDAAVSAYIKELKELPTATLPGSLEEQYELRQRGRNTEYFQVIAAVDNQVFYEKLNKALRDALLGSAGNVDSIYQINDLGGILYKDSKGRDYCQGDAVRVLEDMEIDGIKYPKGTRLYILSGSDKEIFVSKIGDVGKNPPIQTKIAPPAQLLKNTEYGLPAKGVESQGSTMRYWGCVVATKTVDGQPVNGSQQEVYVALTRCQQLPGGVTKDMVVITDCKSPAEMIEAYKSYNPQTIEADALRGLIEKHAADVTLLREEMAARKQDYQNADLSYRLLNDSKLIPVNGAREDIAKALTELKEHMLASRKNIGGNEIRQNRLAGLQAMYVGFTEHDLFTRFVTAEQATELQQGVIAFANENPENAAFAAWMCYAAFRANPWPFRGLQQGSTTDKNFNLANKGIQEPLLEGLLHSRYGEALLAEDKEGFNQRVAANEIDGYNPFDIGIEFPIYWAKYPAVVEAIVETATFNSPAFQALPASEQQTERDFLERMKTEILEANRAPLTMENDTTEAWAPSKLAFKAANRQKAVNPEDLASRYPAMFASHIGGERVNPALAGKVAAGEQVPMRGNDGQELHDSFGNSVFFQAGAGQRTDAQIARYEKINDPLTPDPKAKALQTELEQAVNAVDAVKAKRLAHEIVGDPRTPPEENIAQAVGMQNGFPKPEEETTFAKNIAHTIVALEGELKKPLQAQHQQEMKAIQQAHEQEKQTIQQQHAQELAQLRQQLANAQRQATQQQTQTLQQTQAAEQKLQQENRDLQAKLTQAQQDLARTEREKNDALQKAQDARTALQQKEQHLKELQNRIAARTGTTAASMMVASQHIDGSVVQAQAVAILDKLTENLADIEKLVKDTFAKEDYDALDVEGNMVGNLGTGKGVFKKKPHETLAAKMHELIDLCEELQLVNSDPRILNSVSIESSDGKKTHTLEDLYKTSCIVMECAAQAQVLKKLKNGNTSELVTLVEGYIDPANRNPEAIMTGVETKAIRLLIENNTELQNAALAGAYPDSYLAAYISRIQSSKLSSP